MTKNQKMIIGLTFSTVFAITAYNAGIKRNLTATSSCQGKDNYLSKKVSKEELLSRDTLGVFFGEAYGVSGRYVGKPLSRDGHVLVIGQTGSCKTTSIVNPTMETTRTAFNVILDVKGELAERHRALYGVKSKKDCLVFNPYDDDVSNCYYDPFSPMRSEPKRLADHAFQLAKALIAAPPNDHNQVWTDTATAYTTAVIIDSFQAGLNFVETMERINASSVAETVRAIMTGGDDVAKFFASKLLDMDSKTIAGIGMELVSNLALFTASEAFHNAFTASDGKQLLDWDDLNRNIPFDTILALPEDKLDVLAPMYRLMVSQMVISLECRKKRTYDHDDPPPVLVTLDEMTQLGRIEVLEHALATLRCRGVTILMLIQSLASFQAIYGEYCSRALIENCEYKVILGATDVKSQEYLAKLIGTTAVCRESCNYNVSASLSLSFGTSCTESRENIIQPHTFHTLSDAILHAPSGVFQIKKHPVFGGGSVFSTR